jgi:DNA (cytosine-5)-methyltransferase 1
MLVLSIFPGIDLLGRAFEEQGYCVVRGPDVLWGGDVRTFHPPAGVFAGVIGGPPCQAHSIAGKLSHTEAADLIPQFVRVVNEAQPRWVVMENVLGVLNHPAIPRDWFPCILRDWDCGGETNRTRAFWTWPLAVFDTPRRPGEPSLSVLATTWKQPGPDCKTAAMHAGFLRGDLSIEEYGRLQGAETVAAALVNHRSSKAFAVHVLGNGVPLPMGRAIARAVKAGMAQRAAGK